VDIIPQTLLILVVKTFFIYILLLILIPHGGFEMSKIEILTNLLNEKATKVDQLQNEIKEIKNVIDEIHFLMNKNTTNEDIFKLLKTLFDKKYINDSELDLIYSELTRKPISNKEQTNGFIPKKENPHQDNFNSTSNLLNKLLKDKITDLKEIDPLLLFLITCESGGEFDPILLMMLWKNFENKKEKSSSLKTLDTLIEDFLKEKGIDPKKFNKKEEK
jgi:glutaredoxin 2